MTIDQPVLSADSLHLWLQDLLTKLGVPVPHAGIVADSLVDAELCGLPSHGLSRVGIYVKRLKLGLVDADIRLRTIRETESTLLLDAQNGFGQVAMAEAADMAMKKASLSGVCAVAVRNSTHFGRAGYFAEAAARQGFVAITTTNSAARMAPWGSAEAMFGTNPLAIGIPCEPWPFLLDMSTSVAALGKIVIAAKAGKAIPEGWALDREGRPTTDAQAALDGTLLPVGGPKGSGLALALDILSGVLSGAGFGKGVGSLYRDFTRPEGCGHFMIVLNVAAFMPVELFRKCVAGYAAQIRAAKPAASDRPVILPGELEQQYKAQSLENGIALPAEVYRELLELSLLHDVTFPTGRSPEHPNG